MSPLRLGVSLQPRWPLHDGTAVLRAARQAEDLGFDRLTLAAAAFLTPPGIAAAVPSPGRPLGGDTPSWASVVDDLGRLAEAGLTTCTMWLPVAAEHMAKAMEWIATEVMPQLTDGRADRCDH